MIADLLERHAREIPLWGHLPAALRLKQEAVARLGPEGAFPLLREALQVPGLDDLLPRPVLPLVDAARGGSAFNLLWEGGEQFVREPPSTIGGAPAAPMPGRTRSGYLAMLDDARVRGRSSLIAWQGRILHDIEAGEGTFQDSPGYDPGLLHAEGGTFWMMEAAAPALRLQEAFWLGGSHTVDFGHWVTEYLPKLMLARLAGLPDGVPVLVDAIIPATVREALPMFLAPGTPIVVAPHLSEVAVERLWCAPTPQYTGFYPMVWDEATWSGRSVDPRRMAALLRAIRDVPGLLDGPPAAPRKLFLARKASRGKKKLLNHGDIEALAMARGFERIYPEDHSLTEQIRLAAHATHILAPEGSNGLLAFFANPGARVGILSPPYTYPLTDVSAILHALGIDVTVQVGPDLPTAEDFCPFWNDYRIDPDGFARWLGNWV
jgi:hypothetical protein